MLYKLAEEVWHDTEKTFLDNSAGNGNFLIAVLQRKLDHGHEPLQALSTIYGVELMEDNHREICNKLGVSVNHPHIVCHDALTYDYSFGEPVGVESFFVSKFYIYAS